MASAPLPAATLELRLADTRQLFNAMDPAPFRERDLDPNAEAYIVEWAREMRAGAPLALVVQLGRESATPAAATLVREAVHEYFRQRAHATRQKLRQLLRVGRLSLLIGVAVVAFALLVGEFVAGLFSRDSYGSILKESLVIGAWVALWRPMEIFLYDWWPVRAEARLYDRLAAMDVRVLDAAAPAAP